jgi:hypothetical protein
MCTVLLPKVVDVWIKLAAWQKPWLVCPEPMMMTLLGTILHLEGVLVKPRLCPHHGRMSLGENLDPCWVDQHHYFGVALLNGGVAY